VKFRAAVLHAVDTPLAIETLSLDRLQPGDVLVRLGASGLCHTDLEVIQGSLAYPFPIVLGHEGAGDVVDVGPGVTAVKPGDRVVCSWNPHCGQCFYCEQDQPILCETFTRTQPRGRLLDDGIRLSLDGKPVHHYSVVSSHAEYCVIPESGAIVVPREIPADRACLIGCGVMTGLGAATRIAPAGWGSSVLVIGCGAVGLNAIQGARLVGCEQVIAADTDPVKLDRARLFGATETLRVEGDGAHLQVRERTRGRGADIVYEAAGSEAGFRFAVEAARPGGQIVFLGKVNVDRMVAFRWGSLMGEKRIIRSSYGGARPRRDFPLMAMAYLEGRLKLDELITGRLPLERINDGFAALARGEGVRTVLTLQ